MLRSFVLRLSLWSARRVQQPFNTPHVWSWQRQLSAQVFAGVVRTKGHSVVHQDDAPPHVSVSEAELSRIALTKECPLPGVNFHRKDRAWRAYWHEGQTQKFAHYGIGKLEKKGMTEYAASLAALRAAIATRNEKVVTNAKENVHVLEGDFQAMVETKKCPIPGVCYHKRAKQLEGAVVRAREAEKLLLPIEQAQGARHDREGSILGRSAQRHRLPRQQGWLAGPEEHEDDQGCR